MKYLLDTHVLLWYLFEEEKLSKPVATVLKKRDIDIYVSAVNFWEISVKYGIGKLDLKKLIPNELPEYCIKYGFKTLPISVEEASSYFQLTGHHRDPFDRMLIWQAIQNNLVLISNDENMPLYRSEGLKLLW